METKCTVRRWVIQAKVRSVVRRAAKSFSMHWRPSTYVAPSSDVSVMARVAYDIRSVVLAEIMDGQRAGVSRGVESIVRAMCDMQRTARGVVTAKV